MQLKTVATAASALALAIALAGPANAGNEYDSAKPAAGAVSNLHQSGTTKVSADKLEHASVVNAADERIGEVESIVRDKQSNQLCAVIGVGGFLGVGEKDVAIPLKSLELTAEDKITARDGASKEQLKAQPAVDKARYEKLPDDQMLDVRVATAN